MKSVRDGSKHQKNQPLPVIEKKIFFQNCPSPFPEEILVRDCEILERKSRFSALKKSPKTLDQNKDIKKKRKKKHKNSKRALSIGDLVLNNRQGIQEKLTPV